MTRKEVHAFEEAHGAMPWASSIFTDQFQFTC